MSHPETPAETAEIDPLDKVPAWARGRMLRHLELLDEACEVGIKAVRAVGRRLDEDPGPNSAADVEALARAYAKASRAMRQTIVLQDRLMQDIDAWGEDAPDAGRMERELDQKVRALRIVGRVADYDDADSDDRSVKEAMERAEDLLDDEDLYGDVLDRPLSALVGQLCGDLGLQPDWRRLAAEPWARKDLAAGQACAALAAAAGDEHTRPPPQAGGEEQSLEAIDRTDPERGGEGMPPPLSFEPAILVDADTG